LISASSKDGGTTWSNIETIHESNCTRFWVWSNGAVLTNGTILFLASGVVHDPDSDCYGSSPQNILFLSDSGENWMEREVIISECDGCSIFGTPQIDPKIPLENISISLATNSADNIYAFFFAYNSSQILFFRSEDNGTTWTASTSYTDNLQTFQPIPALVSPKSTTIHIASYDNTSFTPYFRTSTDGGHTWTEKREIQSDNMPDTNTTSDLTVDIVEDSAQIVHIVFRRKNIFGNDQIWYSSYFCSDEDENYGLGIIGMWLWLIVVLFSISMCIGWCVANLPKIDVKYYPEKVEEEELVDKSSVL